MMGREQRSCLLLRWGGSEGDSSDHLISQRITKFLFNSSFHDESTSAIILYGYALVDGENARLPASRLPAYCVILKSL